ncbi:MAG: biotin carboxylase N-terminal domain-containing protein [Oligoflexia bacterium]|nr:biotin carboxylase N-terminal domain-containing protein [Oligoflexia bacterium]
MSRTKVLVANRSEIACRIFQACREMGLGTVAICAPGDEQARHVTMADEVQLVEGYLDIASILAAARKSGATLIHPGYGFLSERPAFAEAVEKTGLIFVGPRAETMAQMGGKIAAKEIAIREGVPTLPWAKVPKGGDIRAAAKAVGFPLLLKASAGGGGKGMRRVDRAEDLLEAAESASAEAVSAFGDGTLFIERLVDQPRHIEVQVFGDGRGHAVHLHDRECSLQRRHQKVWEEALAPHLSKDTRNGLHEAAMRLARGVRYRSAGTLEFLVDASGGYYFLEMNTRLQVEHPVTELVTGVDLVIAQLTQAQDPDETYLQDPPSTRGHAIEVRLYAEDPAQGFVPTPGKVEMLRWPSGPGIRVDSGIEEGQEVGIQFDSMLAKLIVLGQNRQHALARMRYALDETVILGMGTNQAYLRAIADHPAVQEGRVHTGFLGTEFAHFAPELSSTELELIAAASAQLKSAKSSASASVGAAVGPSPWEHKWR